MFFLIPNEALLDVPFVKKGRRCNLHRRLISRTPQSYEKTHIYHRMGSQHVLTFRRKVSKLLENKTVWVGEPQEKPTLIAVLTKKVGKTDEKGRYGCIPKTNVFVYKCLVRNQYVCHVSFWTKVFRYPFCISVLVLKAYYVSLLCQ